MAEKSRLATVQKSCRDAANASGFNVKRIQRLCKGAASGHAVPKDVAECFGGQDQVAEAGRVLRAEF